MGKEFHSLKYCGHKFKHGKHTWVEHIRELGVVEKRQCLGEDVKWIRENS